MAFNYDPMFIHQTVAATPKQVVTAERWNELFNLLITQGDYTAEALSELERYVDEKKLDKSEIAGIVLGQIPDGTITKTKLSSEVQTSVNKADGSVQQTDKATIEEAEAGANDSKYMTPAKTKASAIKYGSIVSDASGKKYRVNPLNSNLIAPYEQTEYFSRSEVFKDPTTQYASWSSDSYTKGHVGESSVSNGTQAIFMCHDGSGTYYVRAYHYDPVTGFSLISGINIYDVSAPSYGICKSKDDPDLAYIVVGKISASTLTMYSVKISTGEILSTNVISGTVSVGQSNCCKDLGTFLVYCCISQSNTNTSTAANVFCIDKSTMKGMQRQVGTVSGYCFFFGLDDTYAVFMSENGATPTGVVFYAINPVTGGTQSILNISASSADRCRAVYSKALQKWLLYVCTATNTFSIYTWNGTLVQLESNVTIPESALYAHPACIWTGSYPTAELDGLIYIFNCTANELLVLSATTGHMVKDFVSLPIEDAGYSFLIVDDVNKRLCLITRYSTLVYDPSTDEIKMLTMDDVGMFLSGQQTLVIAPIVLSDGTYLAAYRAYPLYLSKSYGFILYLTVVKYNLGKKNFGLFSIEEVTE